MDPHGVYLTYCVGLHSRLSNEIPVRVFHQGPGNHAQHDRL
ncbi:hypothetical protein BSU04_20135 [Caballeronia sordidicola]|uniref:Uncharacterized protein n=1 Tax=Caballeronia sordidicola TaxID=196367 RepID=A0A226WVF1_CABSO|nr:hypothetical protein BSU04_28220 [Caballeronia sordidicola]OXC76783.1 hypothetical protein BSU04_20135 [Caballeronia sordidicola]